jgi:hypothetical protein
MDVLALILACSLHPDDALVRTLVDVQSSGNPFFVGDLATLRTNDRLPTAEAALRFAKDLQRRGGRPALGLLGVPLEWAARFGRAPRDLFDGCTNIAVATAALSGYEQRCRSSTAHGTRARRLGTTTRSRTCVLALFARELGLAAMPAALLLRLGRRNASTPPSADDGSARQAPVYRGDAQSQDAASPARFGLPIFLDERAKDFDTRR